MHREVRGDFEAAREMDFEYGEVQDEHTAEDGHGRGEYRGNCLSTDLGLLSGVERWSGTKALGMAESERWRDGRVGIGQRGYITPLEDVGSLRQAVRSHRGIESELHWRLDVTLREDAGRSRRGNAPHPLGVVRHVAVNRLKREPAKVSVGKKRTRAALNDSFRDKGLMGQ